MVICLELGADLHMAQLMPLPLTVSCFSKLQIAFTFLVLAHPGSPGLKAVKRVCVFNSRLTASLLLLQFRPAPLGVHSSAIRRHERAQRTVLGQVSDWFWARSVTGSGPGQ